MIKYIFLVVLSAVCLQGTAQLILTTTGNVKVEDIKEGDRVIGFDPLTGKRSENTVIKKQSMTKKFYNDQHEEFEYFLINGKFKFFSGQSLFVNSKIAHASEINQGDTLYRRFGPDILVRDIKKIKGEQSWVRFEISGDRSYILDNIAVHNATRFWVGGGSSTNWSATANTNWSATSGGANNATVPNSSDDVTFDGAGASGNTASTLSPSTNLLSLTFTSGYTQTLTLATNVQVATNFTDNSAHTYAGTGSLTLSSTGTTTSGGVTWPNALIFGGAGTRTLVGDWTITGLVTVTFATVLNKTSTETFTAAGGLSIIAGLSGTAPVTLTGGIWSGGAAVTSTSLSFAGNVTVSGGVVFNTGTINYVSGTITTTGSTLTSSPATTFNTNGMSWNNITFGSSTTQTINSLLTATGTVSMSTASVIFSGTAGFTFGTLTSSSIGSTTLTLKNSLTYTINTAFNWCSSRAGTLTITSDDATLRANLNITNGAALCVIGAVTRINASGGRTLNTFNGTVTNCINVNSFTDLKTVSRSFVN